MSTQELMKYDLMAVLTEGKPGRKQNKKRWIAQIVSTGFYRTLASYSRQVRLRVWTLFMLLESSIEISNLRI